MVFGRKKEPKPPPELDEDQKLIMDELVLIATKLDATWFKVCGVGIGADGVIGLIPVIGDFTTTTVSLYIVWRCYCAFDDKLRRKWCVMLMNVFIDFCLGSIPLIGDLFDVLWKSNFKNINIVRDFYRLEPLVYVPPEKDEKGSKKSRELPIGDEEQEETKAEE